MASGAPAVGAASDAEVEVEYGEVPVAAVVFDDTDVACRRGLLGALRFEADAETPCDPRQVSAIFARKEGKSFSIQRQEVLLRSAVLARILASECGLTAGDAVFFADRFVARRNEWLIACHRLGVVPLLAGEVSHDFLHYCHRLQIKAVVVKSRERYEKLRRLILKGPPRSGEAESIMAGHEDMLAGPVHAKPVFVVASSLWGRLEDFGSLSHGAGRLYQEQWWLNVGLPRSLRRGLDEGEPGLGAALRRLGADAASVAR